ncbi:MAG TPA: zinc-binding alcohol dehydrogenase family protein [Thermoleophilia bacterium]|nr:zinc-binding alcohol dehydrogenase family protein [Thermoleophilia bacterium]
MKAVRIHEYGGPEVLVYEEAETPAPGPGQVLVRVKAAAVNQVDVAIRRNAFPTPKQVPRILGSDGAGVVEALAPDVDGVRPGDEVFFTGLGISVDGSYAEYAVLPAAVMAVPKPASVSFEDAASLGVAFSAASYALVRRGRLDEGETVLVQGGAGGVGSAAVQLARALGARVLATVVYAADVAGVVDLGAEAVVDASVSDVTAEVRRLTDGKGVDLVLELVASENLATDVGLIVKGGRIVVLGAGPEPSVTLATGAAIGVDASVLFANAGNAGRAGTAEILAEVARLVDQGKLKPVVGQVLPLEQARRAHELLDGHHFGKIVLVP